MLPINIVVCFGCLGLLAFLISYSAPEIVTIVAAAIVVLFFLISFLSIFLSGKLALLLALSATIILFLKATGLVTPINVGLMLVIAGLLAVYFYKK